MKTKSVLFVMTAAACVFALIGSVRADTMFVENFDDGTVGANLVNLGGNQVINGRVYTDGTATEDRNYVVTKDSDYATSTKDWTYTLDVDNSDTTNLNWVRVGIGSGLPAEGTWGTNGMWFYEPANALYLSVDMYSGHVVSVLGAGANGFPTTLATLQTGVAETGTARIKKVGDNLTFGWDQGSTGAFAETTVAISSYPMLNTSSKLFCSVFGGNTTSSVDNFNVTVPEPAAVILMATGLFGILAYAWRKQK